MEHKFPGIRNVPAERMGLPLQKFRLFRKCSTGTTQQVVFHLHSNRNFRNFFVNGKRPFSLFVRGLSSILIEFFPEILYDKYRSLRTVPTFVTAHTFCASRDTGVSKSGAY